MIVCGHDLKPTNPDIPPLPSTSTSCPFSIVSHPWHHLVSFLRHRLGARVDHGATPTGQRSDRRTAGRVSPRATSSSFEPTTRRRSTSDLSEVQRSTRFPHHRDRERVRKCGRGSVPEEEGKTAHARKKGTEGDRDATAGTVQDDQVGKVFVPCRVREGDVVETVRERVERRRDRREVRLMHPPRSRDLQHFELAKVFSIRLERESERKGDN